MAGQVHAPGAADDDEGAAAQEQDRQAWLCTDLAGRRDEVERLRTAEVVLRGGLPRGLEEQLIADLFGDWAGPPDSGIASPDLSGLDREAATVLRRIALWAQTRPRSEETRRTLELGLGRLPGP